MPNNSRLVDHPGRLGKLATIFQRRQIVMAADEDGRLVLVRPDTVVIDTTNDDQAYVDAAAIADRLYPDDGGGRKLVREPGRAGLIELTIPHVEPVDIGGERRWSAEPVQSVIDELRRARGDKEPALRVEANHVLLGSQNVKGSPVGTSAYFAGGMMFTADLVDDAGGEPNLRTTSEPALAPTWLRPPLNLRRPRPRVLVLDTGIRTKTAGGKQVEHRDLKCVMQPDASFVKKPGVGAIDDEDEYDDDSTKTLDFEAGHGTFIAGIIQQHCPDAEVRVCGVLSSFGDGDVSSMVRRFEDALGHEDPFDIVVMSLGGYMTDDDGEVFGNALTRLLGSGLGVAAAGNQATCRPYFPAALPDIIGVGALGEGDKAWFTNFGGWVDACAPGIDVVSTFFEQANAKSEELREPPFTGWARWSGTSFSAPKVAAAIAQEMYLTKSTAHAAWKRLSSYQRYRFPDLGVVFNL